MLERNESTSCNVAVVSCKVEDAESSVNGLLDILRRGTFEPYASSRHNVDRLLVKLSNHMKEMFDCEAIALQQGVRDDTRGAGRDVQRTFVGAPEFINKSLTFIVGQSKRD